MTIQTEPIRWEHRIICNRCKRGKRLRNEEEVIDWSDFIREHGWREDDGYPRRHTCPECIASEAPGVAQQVEGGVWHRYEWQHKDSRSGRWTQSHFGPYTDCGLAIHREDTRTEAGWHEVRPNGEPPDGAKTCKRCGPREASL